MSTHTRESDVTAADAILGPLNAAQREAALAITGPVAILAGAGTGKTTTVTRRIAWQVASGTFAARDILAVTFTDKAAGELRERLGALGVRGIEARTFHSAALWMLKYLWPQYTGSELPQLMPQKILLLEDIVRGLPAPDCFRPRRELAQEIEWAKNRRVTPERYLDELDRTGHEQPLKDARRMQRIYADYEAAKERRGQWDYEDLLGKLADLLDAHPEAAARLSKRFRAVTVDEYQDVNLLQQALLDHWTCDAESVCVVGDDYQTIFGFTGASPSWLLEFPERHPDATVVRLEDSYRSTTPVLALANRLTPLLGGFEKTLRPCEALAALVDPPAVRCEVFGTKVEEARAIARACQALHLDEGVPWNEMAILYRINARSPEFEAALTDAGVPFVVTSGAYLDRAGARGVLRQLDYRRSASDVPSEVRGAAERGGWRADGQVKGNDEAQTLQEDLSRLVEMSMEQEDAWGDVGEFADAVRARFAVRHEGNGVALLTMHRAKGLEWTAVFLPRLNDRELPFKSRTSAADVDDERRLLYVGITRAKRHLALSRAVEAGAPSTFLRDLGMAVPDPVRTRSSSRSGRSSPSVQLDEGHPLVVALREWRREVSTSIGKPAYTVFSDATIANIVATRPTSPGALLEVSGVGPSKLEKYGEAVIDLVREHDDG